MPYVSHIGITNYQHAVRKEYSALSGEREVVQERIAQIRCEYALLPELEANAQRLDALLASAAMLLKDDCGDWDIADSLPVRPWTHTLPTPFGACGRRALEVLRTADRALTVREITLEVLRQVGQTEPDRATLQKAQNAVDASLRHHIGRGVESSDKYPAHWRITARPEIAFDP